MDWMAELHTSFAAFVAPLLGAADFFWDHEWFKKENWENATRFVRLLLCFGGALYLIYESRARRLGQPIARRTRHGIALVVTLVAFFTYFDFFNPNVRYKEYYHRHEFYHYYLGSKYSDELSYTRLYECTAIAEKELGHGPALRKRELRDLRVNLIKPIPDTYVFSEPEKCKKHFEADRWEEFKADVNWFYSSARGTYWENMLKDHGYNPPPVWTMEGKLFGAFGPAGDGYFKILSSIDVVLNLATVLILGWGFGWRTMMVAAIFWGANGPANFYWTGGAFLRQDWLFMLAASLALARKRRFALSGAALTWSALLRIFPLILFAGVGIIMLHEIIRRVRRAKREDSAEGEQRRQSSRGALYWLHPDHRRWIFGCLVAAGTLIPASMLVTSPQAYKDFYDHISVHKNTPLTNTMGLETMLVHTWEGRMHMARNDSLDDPFEDWKQGRIDRIHERKPWYLAIILVTFAWMAWALRRTKLLWVGIPMGLLLTMSLTNLTCYYYSMFIAGAVLVRQRPTFAPAFLMASAASQIVLVKYYWVDDRFTAMSWIFYAVGVMILYVYSRPFSVARLKAWWQGRREPLSGAQRRSNELSRREGSRRRRTPPAETPPGVRAGP